MNKIKKFTTEYTEKNKTHREQIVTPHLFNYICLKTTSRHPKIEAEGMDYNK